MSLFGFLLGRETIIVAAVFGALLAIIGSLQWGRARVGPPAATALVRVGYALTGASMLLMIVAGFISGR